MDPTGQVWLPGLPPPRCHRVADECLSKLCRAFRETCPAPTVHQLPLKSDDLSLACLLLASEWGSQSPPATSAALSACLDTAAGRFWGDLLPWQLALELCQHSPPSTDSLEKLTCNLDHDSSSIRLWMFDLAWCVSDKLNHVEATARLLKDVADTLGYWGSALGLCRSLFPSDEAFWATADEFQAGGFADQYQKRMSHARERGPGIFQLRFLRRELRLRRLIGQTALALTPEELKPVENAAAQQGTLL